MKIERNYKKHIETILVIVSGLMFINLYTGNKIILYFAFIIALISLISTQVAKSIDMIWFKLSHILSLFIPNIILIIIYFIFLTPLSLVAKIFEKKSPLNLKNNSDSLFNEKYKNFSNDSFRKPW